MYMKISYSCYKRCYYVDPPLSKVYTSTCTISSRRDLTTGVCWIRILWPCDNTYKQRTASLWHKKLNLAIWTNVESPVSKVTEGFIQLFYTNFKVIICCNHLFSILPRCKIECMLVYFCLYVLMSLCHIILVSCLVSCL